MNAGSGPEGSSRGIRVLPRLVATAPGWLSIAVGIILTGTGIWLVTRPLSALGVLGWYIGVSCLVSGAGSLLAWHEERRHQDSIEGRRRDLGYVAGCGWMVTGLAILVWIGRNVDLIGPVVALALVVSGVHSLAGLMWGGSAERWLNAMFGLAEIAFGLLALLWPDATLVIVAILFGGRTAIFGLTLIWRGLLARLSGAHTTQTGTHLLRGDPTWTRGLRWVAAVLVLALAAATLFVSHSFRNGIPVADAFYDAPTNIPDTPGHLVRWQEYDGALPDGLAGYRLLYVTTDADDKPILASAVLALPEGASGPVPLIDWAHGTVGVARGCAPSIGRDAITEDGVPAVDSLARNDWAMVATDYPGMGTEGTFPYLIGQGEGRAVLDAARAARQVPADITLSNQTVIWGHSQGGHAALWAGALAATYAPDLDILGTAALAPASNPAALAEAVLAHPDAIGASLGVSFVIDAYARYYDDLDFNQLVAPSAGTIVREAAARCTSEAGTLVTALTGLAIAKDQPILRAGALEGLFGQRLRENIPTGPWSAPLLIGQGRADEVIPFSINQGFVAELCHRHVDVEFDGYPGGTHMSVLDTGSPLSRRLEEWTEARLEGAPPDDNCA